MGGGLFCSCVCMCVQLEMHWPQNTNKFADVQNVWALTCTTFHFIFNFYCFFIGWKICTHLQPLWWGLRSNIFFFSESGHVVYQIKLKKSVDQHAR